MVWSVMAPGSLPALQYGVKLLALLRSCAGNNMTPRGKLTCNLGVTKCSLKLNILYIYLITVGSRSLRDHTFKKLIYFSISVREGVWGIIFGFEGTSGGLCREFIFEFKSPLWFCLCTATAVCWRGWSCGCGWGWGQGLQESGQGVHTGALGANFDITLKITINN